MGSRIETCCYALGSQSDDFEGVYRDTVVHLLLAQRGSSHLGCLVLPKAFRHFDSALRSPHIHMLLGETYSLKAA